MQIVMVIGIGLIAAILCVVLKQYKPEYALIVSLIAGVIIAAMLLGDIQKVLSEMDRIVGTTQIPREYVQILLKCLGLCFLTQLSCEAAKDAGQNAIAAKIELAGKIAILVVSLPLFSQILNVVSGLL